MRNCFASAAVFALLLGGASPALAFTRVASFEWSPAAGPVEGYVVYASIGGGGEELVAAVAVPSASIDVESGVYVSVRVAAFDGDGLLGPISDPAPLVRLCPGDFDGDEVIWPSDVADARACFGSSAEGFCAGADFNLNGRIEFTDLQSIRLGINACTLAATSAVCLGDLDGDHLINFTDFTYARACFAQPAQGACAAADFDDNGIITGFDINLVRLAFSSNACAL